MTNPAPMSPRPDLFVGIDVAEASVTCAWSRDGRQVSKAMTVPQTSAGYTELQQRLRETGVAPAHTLVVLEATSTYWIILATTLHQAGYQLGVVNPAQAHHFAHALLQPGKTDALDARTLALLAARLDVPRWSPPPAIYDELQQRLAQRDALLALRQQVRNQLHALTHRPRVIASVHARMEPLIQTLSDQIAAVEAELETVVTQDPTWAESMSRLQTITGVGLLTAAIFVVTTLNFTLCASAASVGAYAGLVPRPYRSGRSVRGKPTIGHTGQRRLRTAAYMATLSGIRFNPVLKAHYERLLAAGKPKPAARCAVARKLLGIAWAVVTKAQPFDPHYQSRPRPPAARPAATLAAAGAAASP